MAPAVSGVARDRLDRHIDTIWTRRVGVVIGPAGSGKTTLLAQFVARHTKVATPAPPRVVAWYRAEPTDRSAEVVLRHLACALSPAFGDADVPLRRAEDLVEQIESSELAQPALVIDDVHNLAGTEGESCVARLAECLPPGAALIVAGRSAPELNLSRLRVSGELMEIGPDDLRFRTWEVERLFLDVYREPLPPEELARLARHTEGWAAGLQLFHLATAGRSPAARRQALAALATRAGVAREYLTQNVLDALPSDVRHLLVRTSVLGRLSGPICDEFLETSGTALVLADLERRQLFTLAVDVDGTYRYHDVLRSHLETVLLAELGEAGTRAEYMRAAHLLERHGWPAEAVRAHCRAGDLPAAARVLHRFGAEVAQESGSWLDALPASFIEQDPWLILARARRAFADGRLADTIGLYSRAEQGFSGETQLRTCRTERRVATSWLDPTSSPIVDWPSAIRAAVRGSPLIAWRRAVDLDGAEGRLAEGVTLLLAGSVREARTLLRDSIEHPDASEVLVAGARLAHGIASLLAGERPVAELEQVAFDCERLELHWLARLARVTAQVASRNETPASEPFANRHTDPWGNAIGTCLRALDLRAPDGDEDLDHAAEVFSTLGAGTLEAWARALQASRVARSGARDAETLAMAAESLARATGVRGAQALAAGALAGISSGAREDRLAAALAIADELGIEAELVHPGRGAGPGDLARPSSSEPDPRPITIKADESRAFRMRCFGAFELVLDGRTLDLASVRPRARSLLRLLGVHSPHPVHRELLVEALWPSIDAPTATRSLQVALSSLRRLLEPHVVRGESTYLRRDGDAYQLSLPADTVVDLWRFRTLAARGRDAVAEHDRDGAVRSIGPALAIARAELLPEEGPSEWAVSVRAELAQECADLAAELAELCFADGELAEAVTACDAGLRHDRYRDGLWRMLIDAADGFGDPATAARARASYAEVLDELGVSSSRLTAS